MKDFSLKKKIYFVGLIPFTFYFIFVVNSIQENYENYQETKSFESRINVIEAASAVIHESQIERGKSASFLSGGASFENLVKQRQVNDSKHIMLKEKIKLSSFSKEYKAELNLELSKYKNLRKEVEAKTISLGDALGRYTSIIKRFLKIELDLAKSSRFPIISSKLRGYRILEDAKESGGKLRANMSSVLAKNTPISDKKFLAIVRLKAGVDANLNSSGLILDEKSKKLIKKFKSSQEWDIVNKTFQLILLKSKDGAYGKDPVVFFKDITVALNIIGGLVVYQKDELKNNIVQIQSETLKNLMITSSFSGFLAIVLFVFISFMTGSITKRIREIIKNLVASSSKVTNSSEELAVTSSMLRESSSEQAASLQQTVASIHQISHMVEKNSKSSEDSVSTSKKSKSAATLGKKSIDQVTNSINDISETNNEIFKEMEFNNREISKMTSVILEIEEKTKVINDIVFQTKLLSFNASVEAARAGAHGKGFAVVATEIGKLASMSGEAAEEISTILESSIKFVDETVNRSKSKIQSLLVEGQQKTKSGKLVVSQCSKTLDEILKNVDNVNSMVSQISSSTGEQVVGINQIKKTIDQLDQLTITNDNSAQTSSDMASSLKSSASALNRSVTSLLQLVDGSSTRKA